MKLIILKIVICYSLILPLWAKEPIDLITIYRDSLANDSQLTSEQAEFLASKQQTSIALADLLPSLQASGRWNRHYNHDIDFGVNPSQAQSGQIINNKYSADYNLSLSQTIFSLEKWQNLSQAKLQTKRDNAILNNQFQEFIIRVFGAYLNVLRAKDNLDFAQSEEKALKKQLLQTNNRFQVGLDTQTSVNSAQAAYDSAIARTIAEKNILENSIAFLSVLSGQVYKDVKEFKIHPPLIKPDPLDQKGWIIKALTQNYLLSAAYYNKEIYKKAVSIKNSQHYPTINANVNYSDSRFAENNANPFDKSTTKTMITSAGIEVRLPLFSGGKTTAQSKQRAYSYASALAQYDLTRKNLENDTLQLFNRIISKIHQIKALKQAVKSAESAKNSTSKSYEQGASTIVDLLTAQKDLFLAKKSLSSAIYDYLLDGLKLKKLAGTLSEEDLMFLNKYLV